MENSEQGQAPYSTVNGAWPVKIDPENGRPYQTELPPLTEAEAIAAVKRLLRFAKVKYRGKFKITTGRNHTWPRYGVYAVNAEAGWHRLVHSVSHWCHGRLWPQHKPHHTTHAFLERSMIEHVVKSGWLEGKLRKPDKAKPCARELKQVKLHQIEARIDTWQRKARRAQTALAKLAKQRKYYERALEQERL